MVQYAADRCNDLVSIVGGPPMTLTEFSEKRFFAIKCFELRAAGNGTICGGQTQRHSQYCWRTSDDSDCIFFLYLVTFILLICFIFILFLVCTWNLTT